MYVCMYVYWGSSRERFTAGPSKSGWFVLKSLNPYIQTYKDPGQKPL